MQGIAIQVRRTGFLCKENLFFLISVAKYRVMEDFLRTMFPVSFISCTFFFVPHTQVHKMAWRLLAER